MQIGKNYGDLETCRKSCLIFFYKKVWWILTPKLKSPQPYGHSVLHIPTKKSHTRKLVSKAHFLTFVRSVQQGKKQKSKKLCAILVCVLSVVHDKLLFVVVSERN